MGKRTYNGGSTILNRWGAGWSRDDLAPGEPDASEPDPPSDPRQPTTEPILSGREDYRLYQTLRRKAEVRARSKAKGKVFKPMPAYLRPKSKRDARRDAAAAFRSEIEPACRRFRAAIDVCHRDLGETFKSFPRGSCGDVASLLAAYLKDEGLGTFALASGVRKKDLSSHAWLERDGLIVDATVDQFGDGPMVMADHLGVQPMVTADTGWYLQFGEDRARLPDGDFRLDHEVNGARLMLAYEAIIRHIEHVPTS